MPEDGTALDSAALLDLLRRHTFRCVGCTDPLAIALAAAAAAATAGGVPQRVEVTLDRNLFKNALAVDIPGGFGHGPELAAAAGAVLARPERGLLLLDGCGPDDVAAATRLVAGGAVTAAVDPERRDIYVHATVTTDEGIGEAIVAGDYEAVVEVRHNGRLVSSQAVEEGEAAGGGLALLDGLTSVDDVIAVVEALPVGELAFLTDAVTTNIVAGKLGVTRGAGLGIGAALAAWGTSDGLDDAEDVHLGPASVHGPGRDAGVLRETMPMAESLAAGAADARMAGLPVPIIGSFGSGNHGIVLFVTLGLLAARFGAGEDETRRVLALGSLLVGLVKRRTGFLTPHCGCALAAAVGVAGGAAYLLGRDEGPDKVVTMTDLAASLVVADIFGIVCDGAKASCALKIATSVAVALRNTYLAETMVRGEAREAWCELAGLGGGSLWEALDAVERLTTRGFDHLDAVTLDLLQERRGATPSGLA